MALRPAQDDDLAYVERLLAANDLPAADVRTTPGRFYVASLDDDRVGIGGLERYGRDGLLRSVVVEQALRGRGFGSALCDALEATAADGGVRTLYLLTTTAARFFAGRGYVEIDRADAPAAIRETAEFGHLCPASATCMRTGLEWHRRDGLRVDGKRSARSADRAVATSKSPHPAEADREDGESD